MGLMGVCSVFPNVCIDCVFVFVFVFVFVRALSVSLSGGQKLF